MFFNWIDLTIIIFLILFGLSAYSAGFWAILVDFLSFLLSLVIALSAYSVAGGFFETYFNLAPSVARVVGFIFLAFISEAILGFVLFKLTKRLPQRIRAYPMLKPLAIIPSIGQTLILSAFILTLIFSLPLSPKVKEDIADSKIGGILIKETSGFEAKLSDIFGGIVENSLTYFMIKPDSEKSIPLDSKVGNLTPDEKAEEEMFNLINRERESAKVEQLGYRTILVAVARAHASDMWQRHYFGHVSPDGKDVGARLEGGHIGFSIAGENLAMAPSVQVAHTGLMNSPGHRANILSTDFKEVGIGIIDNGIYGKMFVQIFTN